MLRTFRSNVIMHTTISESECKPLL